MEGPNTWQLRFLQVKAVSYFLRSVYKSLHCGYLCDFLNTFNDLSAMCKHTIVFGDFNADCSLSFDSEQKLELKFIVNLFY